MEDGGRTPQTPLGRSSHPNRSPTMYDVFQALWYRAANNNDDDTADDEDLDPDPAVGQLSTAALEVLRDHAAAHMQAFLRVFDQVHPELLRRRGRAAQNDDEDESPPDAPADGDRDGDRDRDRDSTAAVVVRTEEVLFSAEDFLLLPSLPRTTRSEYHGGDDATALPPSQPSERRDAIAQMAYAWLDAERQRQRPGPPRGVPAALRPEAERGSVRRPRACGGSLPLLRSVPGPQGTGGKQPGCVVQ